MRQILVADDDAGVRAALCEALAVEGFAVQAAANADEACRVVEHRLFDAIISDVHMPGNGHTVLRKAGTLRPRVPVILISGIDEPGAHDAAIAAGAFAYLQKPIELHQLWSVLARALAPGRAT